MRTLALASEFPPYRGGIATYAVSLAEAAAQLGADLCVAAPDYGRTDLDDRHYPFEVVRFRGKQHSTRDIPSKWQVARRLIARGGWDLVHAMDWPFCIPVALAAPRRLPRMLTIHGTDVLEMADWHRRTALRASGAFSGNIDVVGNSAFTADLFRRHFPAAADKVRHELLGIGEFWLQPTVRSRQARATLGLPPDAFVVTTVGRLAPRKGHLGVLKALDLLPPALRGRVFHAIVGPSVDDDHARKIEAMIATSGCAVKRFGAVGQDDLRAFYANSDVFCLVGEPAQDRSVEGFGLVYLEAAGQGCPSIAGDIGGVAEVVRHEESGLVVPICEPTAIATALERLMLDERLLERLRAGAMERAAGLTMTRCAAATYGLSRQRREQSEAPAEREPAVMLRQSHGVS
ncbi:MAG: glycosyltransferase family 4 protein [Proteobacteria bacterium]|nr:glycosyltransferase family 4 protein [Pseudomonadota bacterium]